ncbi:hypothetical protein SBDP1_1680016 [Syntrophobacter sp. SbD1]|nr:hypothetical protein SBDP1_1680016 [Syntrophobacter sp. SbD1]
MLIGVITGLKKGESQEEGGGPGFRGIGLLRKPTLGDRSVQFIRLRNNQVETVITGSKLQ